MSELVKRLMSVPNSVYEQVGDDLTAHDHLCVDTAIEAVDRLEALEAKLEAAEKRAKKAERIIKDMFAAR